MLKQSMLRSIPDMLSGVMFAVALVLILLGIGPGWVSWVLLGCGMIAYILGRLFFKVDGPKGSRSEGAVIFKRYMPILLTPLVLVVWGKIAFSVYPIWLSGIDSRSWTVAYGTIISADLVRKPVGDDGVLWRPVVTYEYKAMGHTYTGNRLSFDYFTYGRFGAAAQIRDLVPGNETVVYVNPSKPEISCLVPGPDRSASIYAVLILPASAVYFLYLLIRRFRKKNGSPRQRPAVNVG